MEKIILLRVSDLDLLLQDYKKGYVSDEEFKRELLEIIAKLKEQLEQEE